MAVSTGRLSPAPLNVSAEGSSRVPSRPSPCCPAEPVACVLLPSVSRLLRGLKRRCLQSRSPRPPDSSVVASEESGELTQRSVYSEGTEKRIRYSCPVCSLPPGRVHRGLRPTVVTGPRFGGAGLPRGLWAPSGICCSTSQAWTWRGPPGPVQPAPEAGRAASASGLPPSPTLLGEGTVTPPPMCTKHWAAKGRGGGGWC